MGLHVISEERGDKGDSAGAGASTADSSNSSPPAAVDIAIASKSVVGDVVCDGNVHDHLNQRSTSAVSILLQYPAPGLPAPVLAAATPTTPQLSCSQLLFQKQVGDMNPKKMEWSKLYPLVPTAPGFSWVGWVGGWCIAGPRRSVRRRGSNGGGGGGGGVLLPGCTKPP
jgi:hypothetical protein